MTPWIAALVICACLAVTALVNWRIGAALEPAPPKPEPDPGPEIPPTDPMVLCPECKLLGYHSIDAIPAKPNPIRTYKTPDGDTVEVNVWQGGIHAHYRRQCCFCEHTWTVPLRAAPPP